MKIASRFFGIVWITAASLLEASTLPDGFEEEVVVDGINGGTAFTIVPDGRVFYTEQVGLVRCIVDGRLLPEPLLDLSDRVDSYWERGLIGITHHPEFPLVPYLYLVYVANDPYTHHRVSRFTLVGNTLDPASEVILLEGDDQAKTSGKVPWGHQGGPIKFGPDGKLYIGIGEHTDRPASQALDTFQGKILRINPDGSIPTDNPFYRQTEGKYRAIWAYGIRNPYGLAFHPESKRLYESDVGQTAFEEINEIIKGGNYGWPKAEGFSEESEFVNPIHAYPPAIGRSICGAMFYPQSGNFPSPWKGKLFFVDWAANWIKVLDVDDPDEALMFAKDLNAPVWIEAHPDGSIWVLNRGTRWRDGKVYEDGTGSLVRISFASSSAVAKKEIPFPATLSETGVFSGLSPLKPAKGFVELEMNAPVWLPGVKQRQWLRVPEGAKIGFSTWDHWSLPKDAVWVQHYDNDKGAPHETHVYWSNGDGSFRAAAYVWNDGNKDGKRVDTGGITSVTGRKEIAWFSPGPERRLNPKLALIGFIPQINTRQLHVGSQLLDLSHKGWLDTQLDKAEIKKLPKLAGLGDASASVGQKARSYLDVNCAVCHQPGGPSRGNFDVRFSTPLKDQLLLMAEPIAGTLDIDKARLLVPGSPELSLLYERMKRTDAFRMPAVSVHQEPSPALPVVEQWIRKMK